MARAPQVSLTQVWQLDQCFQAEGRLPAEFDLRGLERQIQDTMEGQRPRQ